MTQVYSYEVEQNVILIGLTKSGKQAHCKALNTIRTTWEVLEAGADIYLDPEQLERGIN